MPEPRKRREGPHRVTNGTAQGEHIASGLPQTADIGRTGAEVAAAFDIPQPCRAPQTVVFL